MLGKHRYGISYCLYWSSLIFCVCLHISSHIQLNLLPSGGKRRRGVFKERTIKRLLSRPVELSGVLPAAWRFPPWLLGSRHGPSTAHPSTFYPLMNGRQPKLWWLQGQGGLWWRSWHFTTSGTRAEGNSCPRGPQGRPRGHSCPAQAPRAHPVPQPSPAAGRAQPLPPLPGASQAARPDLAEQQGKAWREMSWNKTCSKKRL